MWPKKIKYILLITYIIKIQKYFYNRVFVKMYRRKKHKNSLLYLNIFLKKSRITDIRGIEKLTNGYYFNFFKFKYIKKGITYKKSLCI